MKVKVRAHKSHRHGVVFIVSAHEMREDPEIHDHHIERLKEEIETLRELIDEGKRKKLTV